MDAKGNTKNFKFTFTWINIQSTKITQKIEDLVGGTPGLETIDSFSEDESSRITLTFETGLDLDDVTNDAIVIAGVDLKVISKKGCSAS